MQVEVPYGEVCPNKNIKVKYDVCKECGRYKSLSKTFVTCHVNNHTLQMTQEEKSILFKDLCGRLPYGVMMKGVNDDFVLGINTPPTRLSYVLNSLDFKPYLRPLSSMTDEEYLTIYDMCWPKDLEFKSTYGSYWGDFKTKKYIPDFMYNSNQLDYLTSHHFDYRGLIEKGLALEAPEDMYKSK